MVVGYRLVVVGIFGFWGPQWVLSWLSPAVAERLLQPLPVFGKFRAKSGNFWWL
jgi:hypothetical protein